MATFVATSNGGFPPALPSVPELFVDYWRRVPFSLALREVQRLITLQQILDDRPRTSTILDVGVGDGVWWRYLRGGVSVYGVDIADRELARASRAVDHTMRLDISAAGAVDDMRARGWPTQFDGVIANCSLEHVPALDDALANILRVLRPGGWLTMFVPTPWWAMKGNTQALLQRASPRLAMTVSGALNGFFQHWHLMDRAVWQKLLVGTGFVVDRVIPMGNARTEFLFRLGLPSSLIAFVGKSIAGDYPRRLLPTPVMHKVGVEVERLIADGRDNKDEDAYELAFRCRRPE